MNEEQFESWLFDVSKKACSKIRMNVVIAYENGNSIIATREYIEKYHPNASIVRNRVVNEL